MRQDLVRVALGESPASMVIRGGKLVNVFTREIYPADVAILGDRVAAVGDIGYAIGPETVVIDAQGKYLVPGLIDQHIHVHETQLNVVELAAAVLPRGTTGICTDFYGEVVVAGVKAAKACLEAARNLPLKVWFTLPIPAYYQNLPFGHCGQPTREEMFEMLEWPECYGMDDTFASKVVAGDQKMLELIDAVQLRRRKVCGHGSEEHGRRLNAWMAAVRATDDHECVAHQEAVEKARLGLHISMREGSGCYNLSAVVKAVTEGGIDPRRFCFCTDLISPLHIGRDGHIDNAVRRAIQNGLPPVIAIQMATLNAAECLKIDDDHGSIGPGKVADVLLVDDLARFEVTAVVANGKLVARDGQMIVALPPFHPPEWAYRTVRFPRPLRAEDFALRVASDRTDVLARVIVASGDTLVTKEERHRMLLDDGCIQTDVERDIIKIAAIERVRGTGEIGVGLIRGFGLRRGAMATTYNSQQQNLVVVGASDSDMALAANTLAETGGGFVVVENGEVRALLALPLFGLESDQPYARVLETQHALNQALAELGCKLPAPFHTLGFMGLPVDIGTIKICPKGLVDVWKGEVVSLTVD